MRTSYLPNEILWGHQFDHNVLIYDKKMGSYQVHHSRVNKTLLDDTPRVSARQLHMRSKRNSSGLSNSTSTDHSPSKKPFKKAQSATNAWRQHHHKLIIITYHTNNYSNYSFVSFSVLIGKLQPKEIWWIHLNLESIRQQSEWLKNDCFHCSGASEFTWIPPNNLFFTWEAFRDCLTYRMYCFKTVYFVSPLLP